MDRRQGSMIAARSLLLLGAGALVVACSSSKQPSTTSAASNPATIVATSPSGSATTTTTSAAATTSTGTSATSTTTTSTTGTTSTISTSTTTGTSATSTSVPTATMQLGAYFVRNLGVALVHRTVPSTVTTSAAALRELLTGPSANEAQLGLTTAIPSATTLNGVSVSGGVATVDLSAAFGSGGGSLSMSQRLAQVVYTVTQFPTIQAVSFEIDGRPATSFGSEGIVLDHPLKRADFEDVTPAIFVDGPAPFDTVGPTIRVHGTSNVFEATFMVRLTDSGGRVVYEHFQMASSGTGTRGTFDFTIDATGSGHGAGVLRLWEPSAKDGSDTNVVEIPIQL